VVRGSRGRLPERTHPRQSTRNHREALEKTGGRTRRTCPALTQRKHGKARQDSVPSRAPNQALVAPRKARNLGSGSSPMKLVAVTQWVRAQAQVPPDQSLASRSGATSTCTPSNGRTELEGVRRQAA
jgi:hypothetical protein